ncbi:hypothetical protein HPP92_025682 [Vanilla planifolia]|uniref:Uncharacterized protein n=1 Tax=Vanilla planifolia TaxID=51239 RepID=A0A835PKG8_VANPL|nr:hypothetical protein HPP92_025682 [Vanilla planifolia]
MVRRGLAWSCAVRHCPVSYPTWSAVLQLGETKLGKRRGSAPEVTIGHYLTHGRPARSRMWATQSGDRATWFRVSGAGQARAMLSCVAIGLSLYVNLHKLITWFAQRDEGLTQKRFTLKKS